MCAYIFLMGSVIMSVLKLTKDNFNEVLECDKKVLIDFYADWCGPCRMVSPLVDQIAEENPQYLIAKVNVDEEPELSASFNVSSIPMLVVMEGGKVVNTALGARPKPQILALLED